ncbi:STAS domain-containing protein [Pseudonocardia sp. DSM 110487]|uniref:STAS domain-containing protein n=1 Tax=Pseudonocardia sp. DSM 110487 TaxID=2865833 RepID=UPI001C69573A|nr:STAS domain-containing protein [Pseudonocardia sp. DSM 110487]QYN39079.1 STAS domain-containing protein [Pseudonocardia sp. DSM 110487]
MGSGHGGMPPPEELMSLHRAARNGAVVLAVEGEVDIATAAQLREALDHALNDAGMRPVVVDLTAVSFLASRGLAILAEAHRSAGVLQPLRVVVDEARPVIRPLQLSGLGRVLSLFHTLDDALTGSPEVDVS